MSADATTVTEKLERIWTETLGVLPGDLKDTTFFEAGGESISATRMVSRIEDELGVQIEVGDIFEEDPDLEALNRIVTAGGPRNG
ncbi:acyl carrier protein [Streptomyces verrucosisporus]|uniref:acyl carrier protein n=1 Tax=Streptomyces verrucosisporus TaxID=1695161 RepID=UPI0019CFDCC7|nr:acyl carrier protein [Streptomyces verrucosisporus]MBN3932799.1 acyl carrier protein [Streptomyces verrucosisporus]